MPNNNKKKVYNSRIRNNILNFVWNGIVITSTIGGFWFSADLIKNAIWKPKRRFYEIYDDDVISETNDLITESIKKGVDMDYDETLNKLQEIKNLKKD